MNARIEKATAILVGKSLWSCTRAADLASFAFGVRRNVPRSGGGTKTVGEYALHVQCGWRITRADKVLVGRRDLYYAPDLQNEETPPEDFDWDRGPNRQDELLRRLFENGAREYSVQKVEVGTAGALEIALSNGLTLDVFPDDSLSGEHWRLFRPDTAGPHFIVTGRGIET